MRVTKQQAEVLSSMARRPHGMQTARIYGGNVTGFNFVCRKQTLDALQRKNLVNVEHENMSNYWLVATPSGIKLAEEWRKKRR